jgi:hypothetical protein
MAEKTIPNEQAIIDEILRRRARSTKQDRISSAKMKVFKAKLGAEIKKTGDLQPEFVDELLRAVR